MLREQLVEAADALHLDQVEEFLAGVGEVLADVVVDCDASLLELVLQEVRDERGARPTGATGLGALLDGADLEQLPGRG